MMLRFVVFCHRWLGVALAALVALWFASGFVMMYHEFPSVGPLDRLARLPSLDPTAIALSPQTAFARLEEPSRNPPYTVLTTFDGRPAYVGSGVPMVFADDGTVRVPVDRGMLHRVAAAWSGQPPSSASLTVVDEVDQWTVDGELRSMRPLYKYSWPDGQHVYVNGTTADVVQYTTRASRFWSYLGPIPHWLYFTPLRTRDSLWFPVVIWSSLLAAVTAVAGVAIGAWRYSPSRRYVRDGRPARLPYRGWKQWHALAGLAGGAVTVTWALSGWLSMGPYESMERLESALAPRESAAERDATGAAIARLDALLRGTRLPYPSYDAKPPGAAIASVAGFDVKELEYSSIGGKAVYIAFDGAGDTRIIPVDGQPVAMLEPQSLADRIARAVGPRASVERLDRYDTYYLDRRGEKRLPVIRVRFNDAAGTRYYVDPRTGAVVSDARETSWVERWAYHGLHSLDFPWLYNHRPLWDVAVITLLLVGSAVAATSLVLAWKVLARRIRSLKALPPRGERSVGRPSG